jgi:16S rRNA G1207 methylase RsmC
MKKGFAHYFTDQKLPPRTVKTVRFDLKNGHQYVFKSPEGVFAYGKVDRRRDTGRELCCFCRNRVLI